MSLFFVTRNQNKFDEYKAILGNVEQLDIDIPEIQDINPHNIIRAKIQEALSHKQSELLVEDTSLYLDSLNGLPGPLIKWFMKAIGNEGIANLAVKLGNTRAKATVIIGYARSPADIHFFEGSMIGDIVSPKGENRFGWDVIFRPEGYSKTYAEMSKEEKNRVSMRRIALDKLKSFLDA